MAIANQEGELHASRRCPRCYHMIRHQWLLTSFVTELRYLMAIANDKGGLYTSLWELREPLWSIKLVNFLTCLLQH